MRKVDESRAANYIRKHSNYKKWLAFVLCLSLLTGTVTLYILNKPATAMTAEGAEGLGVMLETASNADEETLIQQTLENKAESNEGGDDDDDLFSEFNEDGDDNDENAGGNGDGDDLNKFGDDEETKDGLVEEEAKEGEVKEGELKEGEEQEEAEEEDELTQDVVLTVSYVDEDGEAIADEKEIDINDSIDLASEAPSIEGYTFKEATFKGDVITKVTVKKNADDIRYYEVTFDGDETKEIKKDATVVLKYTKDEEEEEVVEATSVVLTAKYVDKDGEEIQDDEEISFAKETSIKKENVPEIDRHFFLKATYDGEEIVKIAPVEAEEKETEAEAEVEDSAEVSEDEEEEAKSVSVEAYEFTTADGETIEITEDAEIEFTYLKACEDTVFTFADSKVTVTATINGKNVFPDGIALKAVEVTKNSLAYNYDAYIDALNNNAESIAKDADQEEANEFTEDNTLLYDIAFVYEGKEIQPEEGTVSVKIEFKNNQLSEDLSATSEEDLAVVHLPIAESFKEENEIENTEGATGITSSNIEVITLTNASADVEGNEKVEFETDSFSVYAITQINPLKVEPVQVAYDFVESFGKAYDYGIVANKYVWQGDTETNLMVGTFKSGNKDIGVSGNYSNAGGNNYFGEIISVQENTMEFHLPPANVFLGPVAYNQVCHKKVHDDSCKKSHIHLTNVEGTNVELNENIKIPDILSYIDGYYSKYENLPDLLSTNPRCKPDQGGFKLSIDLREFGSGTYVLNYDGKDIHIDNEQVEIYIKENQHLILNCTSPELTIRKYELNGLASNKYVGRDAPADAEWLTTAVIFNVVNAKEVKIDETCGVFIAPNSKVHVNGAPSAGVLIADEVDGNPEWHYHNHNLPAAHGAEIQLQAFKTVNDKDPGSDEKFTFELSEWDSDNKTWVFTDSVENNGRQITFKPIRYGSSQDVKQPHYYRIVEIAGNNEEYTYDDKMYVAKVTVTSETKYEDGNLVTRYYASEPEYYEATKETTRPGDLKSAKLDDLNLTLMQNAPTFNNTKGGNIEFELLKKVNGIAPKADETFDFTVNVLTKGKVEGRPGDVQTLTYLSTVSNVGEVITVSADLKDLESKGAILGKDVYFVVTENDPTGENVIKDQDAIIVIVSNLGDENQKIEYAKCQQSAYQNKLDMVKVFRDLSRKTDKLAFYNKRTTEIKVTKNYIGGTWPEGLAFTFKLKKADPNDSDQPMECTVVGDGKESSKEVVFGPLEFDQSIDAEYKYVISEIKGNSSNVQYDSHEIYVKVVVKNKELIGPEYYSNKECTTPLDKAEFNNYEKGVLVVKKVWKQIDGVTDDAAQNSSVTYVLLRSTDPEKGKWDEVEKVIIKDTVPDPVSGQYWTHTHTGLDLFDDKNHKPYVYKVVEEEIMKQTFEITYDYNGNSNLTYVEVLEENGNDYGTVTITNRKIVSNVLPSTGGIGDLPYMATGAGAAAAALLGTGLYYKKRKDDDQEEE